MSKFPLYTLNPQPLTLRAGCTVHPADGTPLHPAGRRWSSSPSGDNRLRALGPQGARCPRGAPSSSPSTLNTLHPSYYTLKPTHYTLIPQPSTLHTGCTVHAGGAFIADRPLEAAMAHFAAPTLHMLRLEVRQESEEDKGGAGGNR